MKKYLIGILILLTGLVNAILPVSVANSANSGAANTSNSSENAIRIVERYITRYKNAGYSNSTILGVLQNLRNNYEQKKTQRSYTGQRKVLIDAAIEAIDEAMASIKLKSMNTASTGAVWPGSTSTGFTSTGSSRNIPRVCTNEYAPVCGIVKTKSYCMGDACYVSDAFQTTYTNRCELAKVGGTLLYTGECTTDKPVTPACSGERFFDANCTCPSGKSPREVTQSFGEVAMKYYTCNTSTPVKPTCSTGNFSGSECVCKNGSSPRKFYTGEANPPANLWNLYTCDPITPTTPACSGEKLVNQSCICPNGDYPKEVVVGKGGTALRYYTCTTEPLICPIPSQPAPPAGCKYTEDGKTTLTNGCVIPKLKLLCESTPVDPLICPIPSQPAPPAGCKYTEDGKTTMSNGCIVPKFKLLCESTPVDPLICPIPSQPAPPAGCKYTEDGKTTLTNGCVIPKFKLLCESTPVDPLICPIPSQPAPPAGCEYTEDGKTTMSNGCIVPKFKLLCESSPLVACSTGNFQNPNCKCSNGLTPRVIPMGNIPVGGMVYTCEPATPVCPLTDVFQIPPSSCMCLNGASPRQVPMGNIPAGMTLTPSFTCNPFDGYIPQ